MENSEAAQSTPTADRKPQVVMFHYIKANFFRVMYVDGVIGTVGLNGKDIRMEVYNERVPIPLQTTHQVAPDGELGIQISQAARPGIVREVEAELILDIEAAKVLSAWLKDRVAEAEEVQKKHDTFLKATGRGGAS